MVEVRIPFDKPLTEVTRQYCEARRLYVVRELGADAVVQAQSDQVLYDEIAASMSSTTWDDYTHLAEEEPPETVVPSLLASYERARLEFDIDMIREFGAVGGFKLVRVDLESVILDRMTLGKKPFFTTLRLGRDAANRPILSKAMKVLGKDPVEQKSSLPDYFVMDEALNSLRVITA